MTHRIPKKTQVEVRGWSSYIYRMFEIKRCAKPSGDTILLLAGMCAYLGPTGDADTQKSYYALMSLFVNPMQRSRITKAVGVLAKDIENLYRVIDCIHAYNKYILPNNGRAFDKGKYKLDFVIKVMLQIPDADAYVKSLVQSPLRTPSAIFHARTLENAKRRLKGVFGYDTEGHEEQVVNKVKVIE